MIVDSSAIVAILLQESDALRIANAMAASPDCTVPASCMLEVSIVMQTRAKDQGEIALDMLLARDSMKVIPFTVGQVRIARDAFRRYGKGRHPAGLNFGDCMAYAAAKETGEELLFKGTDFGKTDIAVAAY
jgi:ribonuclease VapC